MKAGTKTKTKTYDYYKDYDKYDNKTNFDWKKDYSNRNFLEKVAIWGSFYRANPVLFAVHYFPELQMKLFQMILLHMMFMSEFALMIATRGRLPMPPLYSNV